MEGKIYGYARVSTREQNEDRQLAALIGAGVSASSIFVDKKSGKDLDRPEYIKLARKLRRGDVLVVSSIDRLGRNYADVLNEWRALTKDRGVDIVVLDMPLLDTRIARDLIGTLISDIVLELLSFVAENERSAIRARQAEGIAAARARGVRFGPPPKPEPKDFDLALEMWRSKKLTITKAAQLCEMPRSTFYKHAKRAIESDAIQQKKSLDKVSKISG